MTRTMENPLVSTEPAPSPSTRDLFGRTAERTRSLRFVALSIMAISAIFSGVVIGIMIVTYFDDWNNTPPVSAAKTDLEKLLSQNPGNETLIEAIRAEDQRLMKAYLVRRRRLQIGAWMLLAGLVAFFASVHWYAVLDARIPQPPEHAGAQAGSWFTPRRRRTVGAIGILVLAAVGLGLMASIGGEDFPPPPSAGADAGQQAEKAKMEFRDNWPAFRGPTMMGTAPAGDYPFTWNAKTGDNVIWKTPLAIHGKSSPILWGNRVFLTAADDRRQVLQCFDRETGKLLWQTSVASDASLRRFAAREELTVNESTGYAAPTGVTDGKFVYVTFASSDVGCVDFDGTVKWVVNFGKPNSQYGLASSLALYKDIIIYQLDQGSDASANLSAVIAIDTKSGGEVWRSMERPVSASWSSPVVMNTGERTIVVACGDPWVIAYDPESGSELWRTSGLSVDVAASPVFADGLIFIANANAKAMAIRPGGDGDVTDTHVTWTADDGLPDTTSPIATKDFFFTTTGGTLTCRNAKDGALLWQKELPDSFVSSPTLVGGFVYLFGISGKCFVFELGNEFLEPTDSVLGEELNASPAFGDGCVYVRGERNLYCIGAKPSSAEAAK